MLLVIGALSLLDMQFSGSAKEAFGMCLTEFT